MYRTPSKEVRPALRKTKPTPDQITTIGILIYDDFDSLDLAGPNQVFYFLSKICPDVKLYLLDPKKKKGKSTIVKSLEGLKWVIDDDLNLKRGESLDVIFVPGGFGEDFEGLLKDTDQPFYSFLKDQVKLAEAAEKEQMICSVCVGSLLLARAGLLNGYNCTTHWAFKNVLSLFPEVLIASGYPRYIVDNDRVTGGGISSGIDEALAIVEILKGSEIAEQIQLTMQYAPHPPFNSGDPSVARPPILNIVSKRIDTIKLYDEMNTCLNP